MLAWTKGINNVNKAPPKQDDSLFSEEEFPPLPVKTPIILQTPISIVVPAVEGERSSGCTAGSDPVPIGNSFSSSSHSPGISIETSSQATKEITEQSTTRSENERQDDILASQIPVQESAQESAEVKSTHPMTIRQKSGIRKPNPRYALLTHKVSYPEPKTVAAALKDPGWTGAMGEEMGNCKEAETWSLVPYTPDMHVLGSKWIFRTKLNADRSLQKLKARLVAQGFNQAEGIDYLETYSPVVRTATVRGVLHLATIMEWDIKQMDVQNVFLHGDLTETVYMAQPAGFVDPDKPDHVCKLHKLLYGLKQSPRAWFDKFSTYLLEFGFHCSIPDPSLFLFSRGKDIIPLLLYVDDMLITVTAQIHLPYCLQN